MGWIVDTCILIDIAIADSRFGEKSVSCLESFSSEGLFVSPPTLIEISPVFDGDLNRINYFLELLGVNPLWQWKSTETERAMKVWNDYVFCRKKKRKQKRVIADILIGVIAEQHGGLITRNVSDFEQCFPKLKIMDPTD